MKTKSICGLFVALVLLVLGITSVSAANVVSTSPDYSITQVKIDGVDVTNDGTVSLEAGSEVEIQVIVLGNAVKDVQVKAWIGGYEYDRVEDISSMFEINPGVSYKKTLSFVIPEDMDVEDNNYKLHVEVFDDEDENEITYGLFVDRTRHYISILDTILRPDTSIQAGKPIFASVRVQNMGQKVEENIKVEVQIPELGIAARNYIDELAPEDDYDKHHGGEDSSSNNELYLVIPEDAKTGDYEVVTKVTYNRGHTTETATQMIHVEGKVVQQKVDGFVRVDTNSANVKAGESAVYKVVFANIGETSQLYSVEVDGIETWATYKLQPSFVTVTPGSSAEILVSIAVDKEAIEGDHMFTLRVNDGVNIVKEMNLFATVEQVEESNYAGLKTGLQIAFAVLVLILVVLGIIVGISRWKSNENDEPLG
ncbi:hypothetical protein J4468_01790, partial [Candidatus Woesearchaeota archaeon]|nr:hypothetical protein [Candidatus Woesearchaeota archaeon]